MNISKLLIAILTLVSICTSNVWAEGEATTAGCPPGLLPAYQAIEFRVCGAGVVLALETGGASLVGCAPLVGHITFNIAMNPVCDGVSFVLDEIDERFFSPPGPGEDLKEEMYYRDDSRGYIGYDGAHCFYVSTDGQSEVEMIWQLGSTPEFNGAPDYVHAEQVEIDGTWVWRPPGWVVGDINNDGEVSLDEVVTCINLWAEGIVPLGEVIDAINNWENSKQSQSLPPEAKAQQKQYLMSEMNR